MATPNQEFASSQEIERALGYLLKLQEDPETLEGFFNKYPNANPFTSWPLLAEPTRAFLRFFEKTTATPEQITEYSTLPLRGLVEEFDKEYAAAKEQRVNASTAAKKFVNALKENAKRANVPLPQVSAPMPQETEGASVSPERVQNIISAALRHPGPPEEKMLVFHALTSFSSEQPSRSVEELLPRAVEVTEAARVLSSPEETFPRGASFSVLATTDFQKNVARVLDIAVSPAVKEAVINKILLQPLDSIVNHPEKIPQPLLGALVDRFGGNFVQTPWFTRLRTDANRMIGDQKGSLKVTTRLTSFVSDVATAVFRGPRMEHVITCIETYRLVATQGIPMTSFPRYGNIAVGYGGLLVRMGANYVIKKGVRAGIKAAAEKAAVSTAVKVGAEAVLGAGTGGVGALIMIGADLLRGLVNKGLSVFKSLVGMGVSKNPEDNLLLVVGAGVVLVFFLPILPLFNLPAFNQSMIDTSLATSMEGIGGGGPYEKGLNCTDPVNKENPDCKLTQCQGYCAWPLETSTHACIMEGPLVGTHSRCRLSAIDFRSPSLFGAPVHTPYDGTVEAAVFGYIDNSGYIGSRDGGTYGNHVIVATTNGGHLLFAHLRNIQTVSTGQQISANTVVGFVDHTGYSGGTHLHYEDYGSGCPRSGTDINRFLPYPVPPCLGLSDCATQLEAMGHEACL